MATFLKRSYFHFFLSWMHSEHFWAQETSRNKGNCSCFTSASLPLAQRTVEVEKMPQFNPLSPKPCYSNCSHTILSTYIHVSSYLTESVWLVTVSCLISNKQCDHHHTEVLMPWRAVAWQSAANRQRADVTVWAAEISSAGATYSGNITKS